MTETLRSVLCVSKSVGICNHVAAGFDCIDHSDQLSSTYPLKADMMALATLKVVIFVIGEFFISPLMRVLDTGVCCPDL